jgi:hypothetical protein
VSGLNRIHNYTCTVRTGVRVLVTRTPEHAHWLAHFCWGLHILTAEKGKATEMSYSDVRSLVHFCRGVDGNLHFPVPSMNGLNQTEPATFSILPCWAFFRDSVFIYFILWQQGTCFYVWLWYKRERTPKHSAIWLILGGVAPSYKSDSLVFRCSFYYLSNNCTFSSFMLISFKVLK